MQVGPVVQYWSLDMNSGVVTLTFNEPVTYPYYINTPPFPSLPS